MRWVTGMLAIVLAACAPGARADTIVVGASIPREATRWAESMSVPGFDPALGTLTRVGISLSAYGWHTVGVENQSPEGPDCITTRVDTAVTIERPDCSTLLQASLTTTTTDAVAAWDGTLDFLGPSGRTHADLTDCAVGSATLTAPADLAPFKGAGNILLPVTAVDASSWSDNTGNITAWFSTSASASVVVTYTYDPAPEPETWVLLGVGCGLIGWRARTTSKDRGPSSALRGH